MSQAKYHLDAPDHLDAQETEENYTHEAIEMPDSQDTIFSLKLLLFCIFAAIHHEEVKFTTIHFDLPLAQQQSMSSSSCSADPAEYREKKLVPAAWVGWTPQERRGDRGFPLGSPHRLLTEHAEGGTES